MNGCRLTKMAVEIVSLTHVVTTPDYDVFPHIQSRASAVTKIHLHAALPLPVVLITLDGMIFQSCTCSHYIEPD